MGHFGNVSATLMLSKQSIHRRHLTATRRRLGGAPPLTCRLPAKEDRSVCALLESEEIKRATIYFEIQGVIRLTASRERERLRERRVEVEVKPN